MAEKSATEKKKEHARLLYTREGLNQKESARRAGVTEKTIGKWIKDNHWDKQRAALTITKEKQLQMMYDSLNDLNNAIANREEGKRHATPGEADTIGKYAKAIQRLENDCGVSEIISVFMETSAWIRVAYPEKLKELTEVFDSFIKSKLK
jgi:transcriptional regulator with XRE-family HTH domain